LYSGKQLRLWNWRIPTAQGVLSWFGHRWYSPAPLYLYLLDFFLHKTPVSLEQTRVGLEETQKSADNWGILVGGIGGCVCIQIVQLPTHSVRSLVDDVFLHSSTNRNEINVNVHVNNATLGCTCVYVWYLI
jgi:hypothetical protein